MPINSVEIMRTIDDKKQQKKNKQRQKGVTGTEAIAKG